MSVYLSHFAAPGGDPARPPVLVREGFSWGGLVFGWLALLRPASWLCALVAGIATLLIGIVSRHLPSAWVLLPGLHLAIGLFAADWRCWELRQAGFVPGPLVVGGNRGLALARLLDQRPDLLGRPA